MNDIDFASQLRTTEKYTIVTWWGMAVIIMGTIAFAYHKRSRGENYKLVAIIGTAITIFFCF